MYFIRILKAKVAENIRMFGGSNSNQLKKFPCNVVKMYDLKVRESIQMRVREILDVRETPELIPHYLKCKN